MKVIATARWVILAGWSVFPGYLAPVRADLIRLRGGGEIRGVILPESAGLERIQVQTESGVHPLTLNRWQVLEVIAQEGPLDAYFAKREHAPETATAQYELGVWCEGEKLRGLADLHYQRAVELDSQHEAAHRKLGHVLHEGVWMSYDDLRRTQGLVQYRGRWVSREEYDRETARASRAAEDTSRVQMLIPLRVNLKSTNATVSGAAEQALQDFQNPTSVAALVEVFGKDDVDGRLRLARMLGTIPVPESRQALVELVLGEWDSTVQAVLVDALARRKEPEATQALLKSLGDRERGRVSRAARALGILGVSESVPRLIAVLVRVDRKPVLVRNQPGTPGLGSGSGMNPSWSLASGLSAPALVGAYGQVGLPGPGNGMGQWMGGGGPTRKPAVRMLTRVDRNAEVHDALVTLTGQDFGYDVASWREWLRQNPTTTTGPPTRRIPQP